MVFLKARQNEYLVEVFIYTVRWYIITTVRPAYYHHFFVFILDLITTVMSLFRPLPQSHNVLVH